MDITKGISPGTTVQVDTIYSAFDLPNVLYFEALSLINDAFSLYHEFGLTLTPLLSILDSDSYMSIRDELQRRFGGRSINALPIIRIVKRGASAHIIYGVMPAVMEERVVYCLFEYYGHYIPNGYEPYKYSIVQMVDDTEDLIKILKGYIPTIKKEK